MDFHVWASNFYSNINLLMEIRGITNPKFPIHNLSSVDSLVNIGAFFTRGK